MCCTEIQNCSQVHLLNISGLNAQLCRSQHHVYQPADRCKILYIVDVSPLHKQLLFVFAIQSQNWMFNALGIAIEVLLNTIENLF